MINEKDLVREWLSDELAARGRGARSALADYLGLSTQAISRMTSVSGETRDISAAELLRMIEFFGSRPPLTIDETPDPQHQENVVKIMGRIGAGACIEPEFEQVPDEGIEQIELPYPVETGMIGFRVLGDSMAPTYEEDSIIIVAREQPWPLDGMIGMAAAVLVRDRDGLKRYLKRIRSGTKPNRYNLESINDRSPTKRDAHIMWASPVRMIVPNIGLKRLPGFAQRIGPLRQRGLR